VDKSPAKSGEIVSGRRR